jgi:MOSC domain-containing protein YiiM
VEAVGIELCEPCNHLESLTQPGVMRGLVHRAGINADVVRGGEISVGDAVVDQGPA